MPNRSSLCDKKHVHERCNLADQQNELFQFDELTRQFEYL